MPIQIGGFIFLTISFCIIGSRYNYLNKATLFALFILAQFFFDFGPNTTFIILDECFPTQYRSTTHDVSAAGGKFGAIFAQVIAQPLLRKGEGRAAVCQGSTCGPRLDCLMKICAYFMLRGAIVAF